MAESLRSPPSARASASVVSVETRPPPANRVERYCAAETETPIAKASAGGGPPGLEASRGAGSRTRARRAPGPRGRNADRGPPRVRRASRGRRERRTACAPRRRRERTRRPAGPKTASRLRTERRAAAAATAGRTGCGSRVDRRSSPSRQPIANASAAVVEKVARLDAHPKGDQEPGDDDQGRRGEPETPLARRPDLRTYRRSQSSALRNLS